MKKTEVVVKHDTPAHWALAVNFIPKVGEMIIYDGVIENGKYIKKPGIKFGDGVTCVDKLPFAYKNNDAEYDSGVLKL